MIGKTTMAIIAAIVVVVAAGAAVWVIYGGNDDGQSNVPSTTPGDDGMPSDDPGEDVPETPMPDVPITGPYADTLRDDLTLRVGDRTVISITSYNITDERMYTVTAVNGDQVTVEITDGSGTTSQTYSSESYVNLVRNITSFPIDLSNRIGTGTNQTCAGQVSCGVYTMYIGNSEQTVWISDESGVMYKAQAFLNDGYTGVTIEVNYELVGSTLLSTQ